MPTTDEMYSIARGYLCRYTSDGTYHGRWDVTTDTPPVGASVEYYRCGDANSRSFDMPPVGGIVRLRNVRALGTTFRVGAAEFRRREFHCWTEETAVGDTPASSGEYERVS